MQENSVSARKKVAVFGAGPSGLMAAQQLAQLGYDVDVFEAKPSVARKFLLAGRGGLNITHSEDLSSFKTRYGDRADWVGPWLNVFSPEDLREWLLDLGMESFVGSSGRVFPKDFRAKGSLRLWLTKLHQLNISIFVNHRWLGYEAPFHKIQNDQGQILERQYDASVLAFGGNSYQHMGADGKWTEAIDALGVRRAAFKASNVGFAVSWSAYFRDRFHGFPLKNIEVEFDGKTKRGEVMLTRYGIEGGAIYAQSARLRESVLSKDISTIYLDLKTGLSETEIIDRLKKGRGSKSLSSFLKGQLKLSPPAIALLREFTSAENLNDASLLARTIKKCPVVITGIAPMDRAISTAGGITQ
ncbi:MAG: TIGR03862 family flavoprotein, partial [Alphaproteobacteria bacterium]|nr:TIGR03862 family flavoprotein [Alphaproteobacteria bacterium]